MEGARRMRRMRSEVGWSQVLLCWPQWVVQMPELTCPLQSTPVQSYVHHSMPSPITYHKAIHHKTIYLIFDEERYIYFDVELSNSKTNIIIMILMMLMMMMTMMMISHVHRWVSETVSEWCECGVCEWEMWVWCVWVRDVRVSEWVNEWVSEWVSEWVCEWLPRLPRKSGGAPRDARAYIRPLGSAHCPTPATQKRRSPEGRQGVHPTPWQCTLSHACHGKATEPRLPRKRNGAPRDARAYIRPLGSAHCPTPATPKRRSPKGRHGRTSDPLAVHIVPRLPRKRGGAPRDARAYIRPLGSAHCPTPATQKRRSPKGRQGVHPTPWQCTLSHACHAKEAEPQGTPGRTSDPLAVHIVPRLPRQSGGAPRDARACIRPLGSAHCPTPATQRGGAPTNARAYIRPLGSAHCPTPARTPGRTSDRLAVHIVPRLPRKRGGAPRDARAYIGPLGSAHCPTPATQKRRSPKGRQGVHPTPWQCTLSHACHAKEAEPQGTPGRTSDPLAVHIVPRLTYCKCS